MAEFQNILQDLKKRNFKPVYFLCGEEPYYIDVLSEWMEENILDESEKGFNQHVVYGKEVDLAGILSLAKQFPMMGERQLVIVKEAQNIKELNKSAGDAEDTTAKKNPANPATENFLNYLSSPQHGTILVFCFKYKTPDKRSSITKSIIKQSVYFESKKIYDNKIPDWISEYLKEKKYSIHPKAAYLMAELLGNDLSKIAGECHKLMINLPPGKEITPDVVEENIGISKEYNVFELQDALSHKDVLKSNRIIQYFAANEKENPSVLVLANLYSYFSKVLRYQFLEDKSKPAVAGALGINPFFVDGYARAARVYSYQKLQNIFSYLKDCDLKSKGIDNNTAGYGDLLKELVFKILH